MKTSTLVRNGISPELVGLILRLVDLIPWPAKRSAMGDVTLKLLDGKHRVAEDVFKEKGDGFIFHLPMKSSPGAVRLNG